MMRLRSVLPSSALGVRFRRNADPQSRRHRYNSLAIFISLMEPRPDAFGSCSWHYDFSTMPPVLRRLACPRPASRLVIGCIERLPLGQFYELGGLPRIASECFFIAICRRSDGSPAYVTLDVRSFPRPCCADGARTASTSITAAIPSPPSMLLSKRLWIAAERPP